MHTVEQVSKPVKASQDLIRLAFQVVEGRVSIKEALSRVPPDKGRLLKAVVASLLRYRRSPPSWDARLWATRRLCDRGGWMAEFVRPVPGNGLERKRFKLRCRSSWCGDCGPIRKARGKAILQPALDSGRWIVVTLTYPGEDPPDLAPFLDRAARELAQIGRVDDETVRIRARALWIKRAWRRFMDLLRKERWKRIGRRYKRLWGEGLRHLPYVAVMELRPRLSGALKGEWVPHLHVAFRMAYLDINWIREAWSACGGGEIADVRRAGKGTRWGPEDAARYLSSYLAGGKLRFGTALGEFPEWDRERLAAALRGIRLWMASWGLGPLWPKPEPQGWILLALEASEGAVPLSLDSDCNNVARSPARPSPGWGLRDPPGRILGGAQGGGLGKSKADRPGQSPGRPSWLASLVDPLLAFAVLELGAVPEA
jgi:hypothetical protein